MKHILLIPIFCRKAICVERLIVKVIKSWSLNLKITDNEISMYIIASDVYF